MNSKTIVAENLGPIEAFEFSPKEPGVTVLVAPNGSGKSILLEAVQAAARGEGKLPLRDRTRRGKFEAFGAVITIGGTCRHTGGFEVTNLEGRFDLAALVDPRIKTPAAADRARIKALVSLTGVEASVNLYRSHGAFDDFDTVVTSESIACTDPVEMAAKIKDDYDKAALVRERTADREGGMASALIPPADLDMEQESDADVLQTAYNEARDEVTKLAEQCRAAKAGAERVAKARELLTSLGADELEKERDELLQLKTDSEHVIAANNATIHQLLQDIENLRNDNKLHHSKSVDASARIATITRHLELVADAKLAVSGTYVELPDEDDIADADAELALASAAIQTGVKIREALANASKAQGHRAAAKEAKQKADKYRDAGKATDEVLSSCIKCPQLRVESDGKSARLVTDTERGKSIPYHDLSEGERWTLAIDIGADQVGAGGLLVISQVGWEGIDGKNRLAIHQHAVNRGVYILTAEAASDPEATREIIPTPMPHVEPQIADEQHPVAVPVPKLTAASAIPAAPAAKPKPKAKAVAPPVEATDEDIPF